MRFNSPNMSRKAVEATDFLKRDQRLAAMMPAVQRMVALKKDCAIVLPAMFRQCEILACEDGQLVLSTPNAAVAAKLKQQVPKLQEALLQRGWQIHNVRLKVQMMKAAEIKEQMRALSLPPRAVDAFDALSGALEQNKQNETLIKALRAMVQRRREHPDS